MCDSDQMRCRPSWVSMSSHQRFLIGTLLTGVLLAVVTSSFATGISPAKASTVQPSRLFTMTSHADVASQVSLCQVAGSVTALGARRGVPSNPTTFSFPRLTSVNHAASVRLVARALCGLAKLPKGIQSCPVDLGPIYTLGFNAAGYDVTKVALDPTGCEAVHGLTGVRWIRSSSFWRVLGDAMGLRAPARATFAGRLH